MKKLFVLCLLSSISLACAAQIDQKISITFSGGMFKTFGKKLSEYEPLQMPNYKVGLAGSLGIQFQLGKKLFLVTEFGFMATNEWDYHEGDNNSYLYWSINDSITGDLLAEGYNYLDLRNYYIGIKPVYYFGKGGKWNPFFFAGITLNWTSAWFEDTYWVKADELNYLPPDNTGPYNPFLEESFGIGFNPGLGIEYRLGNKIGIHLSSGYSFVMLNKMNFKSPHLEENLNAFTLQAGIRYSFIKSKDL